MYTQLELDDLDAASGGMMNNGTGHIYAQPNSGGGRGGSSATSDNITIAVGAAVLETILIIGLA